MNQDYTWFVVSERGIESGWEYKSDAQDNYNEMREYLGKTVSLKVVSKRTLIQGGLNPMDDGFWAKGAYG